MKGGAIEEKLGLVGRNGKECVVIPFSTRV